MLPYLQNTRSKTKQQIVAFRGLNLTENHADGEFAATTNLTSAEFPVLTQRAERKVFRAGTATTALYARGHLVFVDGTSLYYYNSTTGLYTVVGTVTAGAKQFATVNTKVVIWPDKVYLDLNDLTVKPLEHTETCAGSFAIVATPAATTFTTTGAAFAFAKGDAVKVSGCTTATANNGVTAIIRSISTDGKTLTFDTAVFVAGTESAVTLSRAVPDMDYICEWNNRLWGCGGGTIYASALGEPQNFNVFDGLSTDSYAVAVGSDGDFTGCMGYPTHILFFKEHMVHKVYGTKPSNYEITPGFWHGIKKGSNKSAAIINGVMYLHTPDGIVAYAGSIPSIVSAALGTHSFKDAVACARGTDYVVSMYDEATGKWGIYVYDTLRGLWMREDATQVKDFAFHDGHLYFVSGNDIIGYGTAAPALSSEPKIEWSAELCRFDEHITETKNYSRLNLRCELEAGSWLRVELATDNDIFREVRTISANGRRVLAIPIRPTRCDSFRLRLSGKGRCRVYTLTREFSTGSDLR